jgi:hypothetical protein
MPAALADLTKKLRLLQTVGKDAAQQWVGRTRELEAQYSLEQAAIKAASEKFPEFKAALYDYGPPPIAEVVAAIEAL